MKLFNALLAKILPGKKNKDGEGETPAGTAPEAETVTSEAPAPEPVDVEAIMAAKAADHPEDLDWKRSIVDLMKLCDMDSSYDNRKSLAIELGYPESDIESKGSAEMNMWLHKQVIKKIAENGGTVPADLLD